MEKGNFKLNSIIKVLLVFLFYFAYNNIANSICNMIGIKYDLSIVLFADCIFMLTIIYIYQFNLKSDFNYLKKNYSWKKLLKTILIWIGAIILFNFIIGIITEIIWPNIVGKDNNTQKIVDLYNISSVYTIFKAMIFAVLAEELLFRESLRDIIHNKWIFVFISSIIFTILNCLYNDLSYKYLWIDIIFIYFLPALFFSFIYIKNESNIILLMLIKFTYNLIPLTLLLLGV